jgi:hypothetical protein
MKTYSTFAGARRAANGRPILRLLNDPQDAELFVVLPDMQTQIMAIDSDRGRCDGSIRFVDLSAGGRQ